MFEILLIRAKEDHNSLLIQMNKEIEEFEQKRLTIMDRYETNLRKLDQFKDLLVFDISQIEDH